ncbi:hypothetical protein [Nocardioides campestrisoli]|uniref:hypothetical protein n=1 Tax=Nocardioides campestrisoli TaxID=2736757 RepID=UPI0015E6392D|nr:hypothetical protein [Nocardioides campestrisoli]
MIAAQTAVPSRLTDHDRARFSAHFRFTAARDETRKAGRRFSPLVVRRTRPAPAAVDAWIVARAAEYEARADWLAAAVIAEPAPGADVIPLPRLRSETSAAHFHHYLQGHR